MSASVLALAALGLAMAEPASESMPAAPVVEAPAEEATPSVPVLRSGIPLGIDVAGGQRYEGAFVGMSDDLLRVSTRDGVVEIPVPVVLEVEVEGVPYGPGAFLEGVRLWGQELVEQAVRVPHPVLAGGLSVLWAGAGPASLGQWKSATAYSLLELAFVGAGAIMISNDQYGPLLPLAALDGLLHVWAGGEAVRESRRRRSRAELALLPIVSPHAGPGQGAVLGLAFTAGAPIPSVSEGGPAQPGPCVEQALTGGCSFP